MKGVSVFFLSVFSICVYPAFSLTMDEVKEQIGWTQLQSELGSAMPDGSGIDVQHVEVDIDESSTVKYMPDSSLSYFSSDTFIDKSGINDGPSWHANKIGRHWYSSEGIAPGVGTNNSTVYCYEANDWMDKINNGYIGLTGDVINNSWIGRSMTTILTQRTLNRIDYYIKTQKKLIFSGLQNGYQENSSLTDPIAWATYNGIAVGRIDGNHSYGKPASQYGSASKPDIVAPAMELPTSYATPVVAGVGSMLLQYARDNNLTQAEEPITIKSILLAGAKKPVGWGKGNPNDPTDDDTNPLDRVYGAGIVDVYTSYHILTEGEKQPDTQTVYDDMGWCYDYTGSTDTDTFFIEIEDDAPDLSAVLTWYSSTSYYSSTRTLGDHLYLKLYETVYENGTYSLSNLVQQSISDQDTVQLIWAEDLDAGVYALVVEGVTSENYALAWAAVPEPTSLIILLVSLVGITRKRL